MQNRHATNLEEAINSAVTIENELECIANLRNIRKDNHSSRHHPYIHERPQRRDEYRHVNKIEMTLNKSNGTYNAPECYGCGKPGHYKRNENSEIGVKIFRAGLKGKYKRKLANPYPALQGRTLPYQTTLGPLRRQHLKNRNKSYHHIT